MNRIELLASIIEKFTGSGEAYTIAHIPILDINEIRQAFAALPYRLIPSSDGDVGRVENLQDLSDFGRHSGAFDFHVDGGARARIPKFVLLYCIRTRGRGGRTFITETADVIALLKRRFGDELIRKLELVLMKRDGTECSHPLIEECEGKMILHWYTNAYLKPRGILPERERTQFTKRSAEIITFVVSELRKHIAYSHSWTSGDCLFFNNHRVLHGRTKILDMAGQRLLYRLWFE